MGNHSTNKGVYTQKEGVGLLGSVFHVVAWAKKCDCCVEIEGCGIPKDIIVYRTNLMKISPPSSAQVIYDINGELLDTPAMGDLV